MCNLIKPLHARVGELVSNLWGKFVDEIVGIYARRALLAEDRFSECEQSDACVRFLCGETMHFKGFVEVNVLEVRFEPARCQQDLRGFGAAKLDPNRTSRTFNRGNSKGRIRSRHGSSRLPHDERVLRGRNLQVVHGHKGAL